MKIKLITIGKLKSREFGGVIGELLKRCRPFATIEMVELTEHNPSKTVTRKKCLEKERQQILKALHGESFVVVMDERGKEFGSREFAEILGKYKDEGRGVCFVIGGAFGLAEEVRERADLVMALSKMTFTHEMARLFLVEQVYRGLSILAGKEYHID